MCLALHTMRAWLIMYVPCMFIRIPLSWSALCSGKGGAAQSGCRDATSEVTASVRMIVLAGVEKTLTTWGQLLGSLCESGGWSRPCSWQPIG